MSSSIQTFQVRFSVETHESLRNLSFQQRTSIHSIVLDAVERHLKAFGVPNSEQLGFRCVSPDTLHPIDKEGCVLFLENIDPSDSFSVLAVPKEHLEWFRMLSDLLSEASEKLRTSFLLLLEGCWKVLHVEQEKERIQRGRDAETS